MDSSPDLSLKLRRGSSDSRDSFYMDFAQGIDSDIEEVDTTIIAKPPTPPKQSQPSSPPPPQSPPSSHPPSPPTPPPPPPSESPPALPLEVSELPEAEIDVMDFADGDTTSNDADDDEEEEKIDSVKEIENYLPPTPPLPPLPPPHAYSQDSQATTSPSSSPSPPPTPPPCPPLSVAPPVPLPLPPLTLTPPGSPSLTSPMTSFRANQDQQPHPTGPTTPPDVQSDVDPDVVLSAVAFQIGDDTTEESSTTITTPPSNGFGSSSSAVTPVTTTNIVASVNEHSLSGSEASLILPVTSTSPTPQHDDSTISDDNRTPVGRQQYHDELQYLAQQAIQSYQSTSPMSSANILIPSESASHCSSPGKSSARLHSIGSGQHSLNHHQHHHHHHQHQHRVTIDETKLPMTHHHLVTIASNNDPPSSPGSSQHPLTTTTTTSQTTNITATQTGHLALMYHSHQLTNFPVLPAIKRPPPRSAYHYDPRYTPVQKIKAGDALATLFSALYGKLLVVMGIAFPMAEVISTYIPPSFYEVFYLYLYIGSMLFLFFMYGTLLWGRPKIAMGPTSPSKSNKRNSSSPSDSMDESDTESSNSSDRKVTPPPLSARRPSLLAPLGRQHHYGSFYLRMGAVAFGIGSMIYSGLEFGQYFELERDTKCHNVMLALTPATRMAFIFIQMYFIFLNNEQIKVYRHKILARFGLMHMIGTNLAVWLNVLIQETKHEILTFYNPENRTLRISHRLGPRGYTTTDHSAHLRTTRGLKGPYQIFECRRTNILGTLVQDASPFLFPCTIEYSLICAAILYVMWRSISRPQSQHPIRIESAHSTCKRSPHHYSVDCARAHKGLFVGILILVLTIISLILFFVLISRPEFISLAVTEVTICELFIYGTATIATLVGMIQIRHLEYDAARSFQLDDILLVGAQTGSFLYNTFTVIAGHFTLRRDTILILVNALASIVQTACQTMFILDASRRQAASPEHIRKKPGREIVTFMLVVNLAMWAISTLEKSRAESHPIQLNFYGLWAWTIITHVSMPLAIFYRFHSTVCLCEIWKRAYKLKPTYM